MRKNQQELFYAAVGKALTTARENMNISVSQLAKKADQQYNSILAIEKGRPFSFHHAPWIKDVLGIDINELLKEIKEEKSDIKKETSINDFI